MRSWLDFKSRTRSATQTSLRFDKNLRRQGRYPVARKPHFGSAMPECAVPRGTFEKATSANPHRVRKFNYIYIKSMRRPLKIFWCRLGGAAGGKDRKSTRLNSSH